MVAVSSLTCIFSIILMRVTLFTLNFMKEGPCCNGLYYLSLVFKAN